MGILVVSLGLRIYEIETKSLWYDETCAIDNAIRRSLPRVIAPRYSPSHGFVYFLLLRFWSTCFGGHFVTLRLLSAILGVLSVFMTYKVGSQLMNRSAALLASLFLAVAPFHIFYSQEIGNFSLCFLVKIPWV